MEWKNLLCESRQSSSKGSNKNDLRNEFQKDYHRIICSASFRRLQDKTVTDYICGMTDSFAKRLYQELNGIM